MSERKKVERALRRLRVISTVLTVVSDELNEVEGEVIGHGFSGGGCDRVDDVHRVMSLKREVASTVEEVLAANEHFANRVGQLRKAG